MSPGFVSDLMEDVSTVTDIVGDGIGVRVPVF